ncbi:MAG: flagellar export chaperone FliS [Pseudomonadota bacterium]|nr:flagellar export chaperone FliS [Pseudomonadota bacterium]
MFKQRAAQAYAKVGLETGVATGSPHSLILMLYDGALKAIAEARAHLVASRIAPKGEALSRAIGIIETGLKGSLDVERGGAIGLQLRELYDYMNRRLLLASMRNDPAGLDEVAGLLRELRGAWSSIDAAPVQANAPAPVAA